MNRQEKEREITDLRERFAAAKAAVLTQYKGLTVEQLNTLRRELREVNGEYRVAKNTLIKLAVSGTQYSPLQDLLVGQNGLAFGYVDAGGVAKVLKRYGGEHGRFVVCGGVTDGQWLEASKLSALADLPSHDALRAQLLGLLSRPAAGLVRALAAPAGQLARVLEARRNSLE